MNRYETINQHYLEQNNFTYKGDYGFSQIWSNKEKGLLLDKIKENNDVFKVRFEYKKNPMPDYHK